MKVTIQFHLQTVMTYYEYVCGAKIWVYIDPSSVPMGFLIGQVALEHVFVSDYFCFILPS